jgi:hypothetical protein
MELQHKTKNNIEETKFCISVYAGGGIESKTAFEAHLSYCGKISVAFVAGLPTKRAGFPWYSNIPISLFLWYCILKLQFHTGML